MLNTFFIFLKSLLKAELVHKKKYIVLKAKVANTQNSLLPNYFAVFYYYLCSRDVDVSVYYICMVEMLFDGLLSYIYYQLHVKRPCGRLTSGHDGNIYTIKAGKL